MVERPDHLSDAEVDDDHEDSLRFTIVFADVVESTERRRRLGERRADEDEEAVERTIRTVISQ